MNSNPTTDISSNSTAGTTGIDNIYIREQNQTLVQTIGSLITDYNENINYYNSNIRRLIDILHNHQSFIGTVYNGSSERFQRMRRNVNVNRQPASSYVFPNIIYEPILETPEITRNYRNIFQTILEDVVVRPSAEQLYSALEDISYNGTGATCPITLEPFETGERICRIRDCGHIFKRTALYDWFSRNVRCPICRYDIRETISAVNRNQNTTRRETDISGNLTSTEVEVEIEEDEDVDVNTEPNLNINVNANSLLNNIVHQIFPQTNQHNNEVLPQGLRNFTGVLQRFLQRELQNNPEFRDITFDITF